MAEKRSDKSSCSLVWDFRDVPPEELHACFLYEYARESRRIRALARRLAGPSTPDSADEPGSPFMLLQSMNRDCARVLNLLSTFSPHMDMDRVSWFEYEKPQREAAAMAAKREFGFQPLRRRSNKLALLLASSQPLLSRWGWEDFFCRQEEFSDGKSKVQYEAFQINWCEGIEAVLEDARSWLEANRPAGTPVRKRKKGRHARPEAEERDALRQLGAMRLLSAYPLKKAIEITKGYNPNGDSLYAGFIDGDGRPQGQTAWDNAIKSAVDCFRESFKTDETDGPISYQAYKHRQGLPQSNHNKK